MFVSSKLIVSLISTRYVLTLANFVTLILALKALTIEEFADLQRVQLLISLVVMIGITWTERIFFSRVGDHVSTTLLLGNLLKIRFIFVILTLLLNIFWISVIIEDLNLFGYIVILTIGSTFQTFALFLNYMHVIKQTWRITSIRASAALISLGLKVIVLIYYPTLTLFLIAIILEPIIIFFILMKFHSSKIKLILHQCLFSSLSIKPLLQNNISLGMTIGLRQTIRSLPLIMATSLMSDVVLVSFSMTYKVLKMFGVISSSLSYAVGVQIINNIKIKNTLLVNSIIIIMFWVLVYISTLWINQIDSFWQFMSFDWRFTELNSLSLLLLFVSLTALWEIFLARYNLTTNLIAPYIIFVISYLLTFAALGNYTFSTVLSSAIFYVMLALHMNSKGALGK